MTPGKQNMERKAAGLTVDMTKGRPLRLIVQFTVPLLIGVVVQQAYNFVDIMIVGQSIGDSAVAAIGVTAAVYSLLINFANGLNSGCGIVISRLFGSADEINVRRAFAVTILLNLIVTIVLTGCVVPFLKDILHLLDTPESIFGQAYEYIVVILAGMAATNAFNAAAGFMRAVGNSRTPLYFLILASALNIGLDFLFVVGLHGGVGGAAIATVIAQALAAALCFVYVVRKYPNFLPHRTDWRPQKALFGEVFTTGLSMGLVLSVFSLGSIILQKGINGLGEQIITAHTASRRVFDLLAMPLGALGTAMATFVGQNYGAALYKRIKNAMWQVMGLELLWSLISLALAYFAGEGLIGLVITGRDAYVMENALLNLRAATWFFFPLGVLLVLRQAIQAMGGKITPVLSSVIELVMKVVFCFVFIPRMGYFGVVITEPVIWVMCAVFLAFVYLHMQRHDLTKTSA